jgi:hypothetical protein
VLADSIGASNDLRMLLESSAGWLGVPIGQLTNTQFRRPRLSDAYQQPEDAPIGISPQKRLCW